MKLIQLLFAVISCITIYGQNSDRRILATTQEENYFRIATTDGDYYIGVYSNAIIETKFIPTHQLDTLASHAITGTTLPIRFQHVKQEGKQCLIYGDFTVEIQDAPFQISYYYKKQLLIAEKTGYHQSGNLEVIDFQLNPSEQLYGGGARALGMNRRGNRLELYNRAHYGYEEHSELMNFGIPVVISSNKYLIHFDNASTGFLDLDAQHNNTLAFETTGGRKTYQIVAGETWDHLLENYTFLTGRQPLPPRWAFGNFASRFGYHSQSEAAQVVNQFRNDSIPLDAIILDLYWFGKTIQGTMGNLSFDTDSFPNPHQMITDFAAQGVKTVLITEPFILTTSKRWQETQSLVGTDSLGLPLTYPFYFGNTGLLDIYKPQTRTWFWGIYKELHAYGVAGIWGDLGEPEVHPSSMHHAKGMANEVHNIYGHDWAKLITNGYQSDFATERPFILMRSGYSGSQRYGMIPWSGDVNRSWGGLRSQPEIALQMGMQGMAYMHSDLGGFAGDYNDPELYVRWLQYGVFQPVFRPHSQEQVASEPIYKDSLTKALAKKAIELRYAMLPYNYSLAYQNSVKGTPLMRPLFFDFENDSSSYISTDRYLWGTAFLVVPITQKGETQKSIRFPGKGIWYDFYGKTCFNGGSTETVQVSNDHLPVFIKGGSFVPLAATMQSTDAYDPSKTTIHFYVDPSVTTSNYYWYNDDGKTPTTSDKCVAQTIVFAQTSTRKYVEINISSDSSTQNQSISRTYPLVIHGLKNAPKSIKINGKKVNTSYNAEKEVLTVIVHSEKGASKIRLKY
jgi:oligosaccharide 4-alpha-D-glucosyltransferase